MYFLEIVSTFQIADRGDLSGGLSGRDGLDALGHPVRWLG